MPTRKEKTLSPLERFREVFVSLNAPKGGLPTMPTRISDIASDELGDMIARYSSWREYTEDRHAEACAVFSQLKSEYDLELSKAMLKVDGSSVTEKKAYAQTEQGVLNKYKQMNEADVFRGLLANKLESFTNVLLMLSRELTRRGIE